MMDSKIRLIPHVFAFAALIASSLAGSLAADAGQRLSVRARPAPVPAGPSADARHRVEVIEETAEGLRLVWTREPGDASPLAVRVIVPPGHRPRIDAADARVSSAIRLERQGWRGLVPLATLVLDPSRVPGGRHEVELSWEPAPRPTDLPPGLRAAEPVPLVGPEFASLADAPVLNPQAAAAAEAMARADRSLRAPSPPLLPRGNALRRLGMVSHGQQRQEGPGGVVRPHAFGTARVKVVIAPDEPGSPGGAGIYRLTHAMLTGLGLAVDDVPLADLRLRTLDTTTSLIGQALVPLRREDANGDGLFGSGDWIEFWGEPLLGEAISVEFQAGDFTDRRGYILDAHAAEPSPDFEPAVSGAPVSPESADFLATVHAERDDFFINATRIGMAGVDHFYWCSPERLQWISPPGTEARRTESVDLPGLVPGSARTGAVRVRLLHRLPDAIPSPDHRSVIDVNGRSGLSDLTGDGYARVDHEAAGIPAADLLATTSVTIRAPGVPGATVNLFDLDWIEVDYPRSFDVDDGRLVFEHDAGWAVTVRGLAGPDVVILDVTDPLAPRPVADAVVAGDAARFDIVGDGSGEPSRIAVQHLPPGEPALLPAQLELLPDTGLRDPSNSHDALVIGPRAWLEAVPPIAGLERWIARRQGEGLGVRLVSTEDAMDEFGLGSFTPVAIAGLFSVAHATWAGPPRYAVLVGDASVDYKNVLGGRVLDPATCADVLDPCLHDEVAWAQHVPTRLLDRPGDTQYLGWYASDVLQALIAGNDWDPDLAVGRLPVRSAAEAGLLFDKVLQHEDLAATRPSWVGRVLMVADQILLPAEQAFETYQDTVRDAHVQAPYSVTQLYYQRDHGGEPPEPFTQELLDTWSDPSRSGAVLSYVGHGSAFRWSGDDILLNRGQSPCRDDVDTLSQPGVPAPIVLNANCITGTFVHPLGPALLEELVRAPQGGAIAAYGPTGVTELDEALDVLNAAFSALTGRDGRGGRTGDMILRIQESLAFSAIVDPLPLLSNAFLGDPTHWPAMAHGPAASALTATPGDALVDLSWPAVSGASTYSLWRTGAVASGTYELIAQGVTGTTFRDTGDPPGPAGAVINGQLYHYALEPFDADGYPGRWSARVPARPCTLDVPEPASALVVTPGNCTASTTVRWTASPTPSLQGYRLHVYLGESATGAPVLVQLAPGTFALVRDLVPFQDYTFTVRPLSWCGIEGPPTAPVTIRQTCPLELDVPAFIQDLRLRRLGADVELSWSPVTETVLGTPASIASYRVYRADAPDFLAEPAIRISDAAPTTFVDVARVGTAPDLQFYAVAAVDATGRSGGVGHDLPRGARGVAAVDAGGEWEISWSPVQHDIQGQITAIREYEIYNSDTALTRTRIEAEGLVPVATAAASPVRVPMVPGADFWFVVPVDVHGNRSAD